MIELAIGTRFNYIGRPCEVVEENDHCSECVMFDSECDVMSCLAFCRKDGKNVSFKWVEK